ncbi:MAG: sulfite exporter TauE/SafE family protein [Acidimicrobiia bacterium]|nr:sulfite exporter TauE/SafE family protein [Acidimicrobiia bacterium]
MTSTGWRYAMRSHGQHWDRRSAPKKYVHPHQPPWNVTNESVDLYRSSMTSATKALALGVVAGFVGGLLGVGGGVIMVPGLVLWLALDQRQAAASSLAAIIASAGSATLKNASETLIDWPAAALLFVGAGLGAYVGARSLDRLPVRTLSRMFIVVLLLGAGRMAFG